MDKKTWVVELENVNSPIKYGVCALFSHLTATPISSRCFPDDEDAHDEDHDEEYPHEDSVHDLGHLLPFGYFQARGLLLAEAVCDIFHIPDQLRIAAEDSTAAVNTGVKGQREGSRFVVVGAAGGRSCFRLLFGMELLVQFLTVERLGFLHLSERRSAALADLIDEEDFGHVVDDEDFGPVRHRFGLGSTEVNVHDEDGQSSGRCDHSHRCYVVFT